jgi:hypothetical protein
MNLMPDWTVMSTNFTLGRTSGVTSGRRLGATGAATLDLAVSVLQPARLSSDHARIATAAARLSGLLPLG